MEPGTIRTVARLDPSYWDDLLKEWRVSDESQRVFCKRKSISYNSFVYWRLKRAKKNKHLPKASFAKASVSSLPSPVAANSIRVVCSNGLQVIIPVALGKQELKTLLELMGITSC